MEVDQGKWRQEMIVLKADTDSGVYTAQFAGEDAQKVIDLFGTDTLPTPYKLSRNPEEVRDIIQACNEEQVVLGQR